MSPSAWAGVDIAAEIRKAAAEPGRTLRLVLSRSVILPATGGAQAAPLVYVESIDAGSPRKAGLRVLPGPLLPAAGGSHAEVLRAIADVLDGTIDRLSPVVVPEQAQHPPDAPWRPEK